MAYDSGICEPWINAEDLDCLPDGVDPTDDVVVLSVEAANEVLFALSGSQYPGTCTETVKPTACSCVSHNGYPGRWSNVTSAIQLGYHPIKSIGDVIVDGATLDPSAYKVDEEFWLVRIDGFHWPCQQHRDKATSEFGTWSVEVVYGEDPPAIGIMANKKLACEFINAQTPDADCALPENVQTLTRLGVSVAVQDITQLLANRRTGITIVDLFLNTYNPDDLDENFAIGIPTDLPTVMRETWP